MNKINEIAETKIIYGKILEHSVSFVELESNKALAEDVKIRKKIVKDINYNVIYEKNMTTVIINKMYTGVAFCHPLEEFDLEEGFKWAFNRAYANYLLADK